MRADLIQQSGNGVYAIRSGPWKWIEGVAAVPPNGKSKALPTKGPKADEFKPQLINLREDPAETTDVAAKHREIAEDLAARLEQHRAKGYSRE